MSSSPVCGTAVKPNGLATHVELTVEGLRTGVRFPPAPPNTPNQGIQRRPTGRRFSLVPSLASHPIAEEAGNDQGRQKAYDDAHFLIGTPEMLRFMATSGCGDVVDRDSSITGGPSG